jgi:hypothetical protein
MRLEVSQRRAAGLLHVGIELVDQRRHRHARAVALGLVEHQPQVLAHPVDREAVVELAGDHGLAAVFHLPALGRALADDAQHGFHVEPGALAEGNGFRQALHQARDGDLVDHLRELAGAALAQQRDRARERHGHRLDALEHRRVAAAHDGERAVLRAGLAARDGRVDEVQAERLRRLRQFARHVGRGGGVVDEGGALLHAGEGAVVAQHHGAQVVVVADAAEHDVGAGRGFARGRCVAARARRIRRPTPATWRACGCRP